MACLFVFLAWSRYGAKGQSKGQSQAKEGRSGGGRGRRIVVGQRVAASLLTATATSGERLRLCSATSLLISRRSGRRRRRLSEKHARRRRWLSERSSFAQGRLTLGSLFHEPRTWLWFLFCVQAAKRLSTESTDDLRLLLSKSEATDLAPFGRVLVVAACGLAGKCAPCCCASRGLKSWLRSWLAILCDSRRIHLAAGACANGEGGQ